MTFASRRKVVALLSLLMLMGYFSINSKVHAQSDELDETSSSIESEEVTPIQPTQISDEEEEEISVDTSLMDE